MVPHCKGWIVHDDRLPLLCHPHRDASTFCFSCHLTLCVCNPYCDCILCPAARVSRGAPSAPSFCDAHPDAPRPYCPPTNTNDDVCVGAPGRQRLLYDHPRAHCR